MKTTSLGRSRGFSVCEMCAVIAIITILMGIFSQGVVWMKTEAEMTSLVGRAGHFATALELYYQQHRQFPDAYPAHLEVALAPYIDDATYFNNPAHPEAGAEPVNLAYVAPTGPGGDRYVLSFDSKCDPDRAVVLYSDAVAEKVEKLPVECNGQSATTGSIVKGGTITFDGGSKIELSGETVTTLVQSFKRSDGTPCHVVKQTSGEPGGLTAEALDDHVIEVASAAGITLLRGGSAQFEFIRSGGQQYADVKAVSGEVVADGRVVNNPGSGGSPENPNQNLAGWVNINPSNNDDFEFMLEKPDGTLITRDDIHDISQRVYYAGHAVMIRFRPKGNGNQNSLFYNGQVYPVKNGRLYTITASNMTVVLFNDGNHYYDAIGTPGRAMGKWWLYGFYASDAQIVDSGAGGGNGNGKKNEDGGTVTEEPTPQPPPAEPAAQNGRGAYGLGRGTPVPEGREVRIGKYN